MSPRLHNVPPWPLNYLPCLEALVEFRPNELQDLADVLGEIGATAAGDEFQFNLHIKLGGKTPPPRAVVDQLNQILKRIFDIFQPKWIY